MEIQLEIPDDEENDEGDSSFHCYSEEELAKRISDIHNDGTHTHCSSIVLLIKL